MLAARVLILCMGISAAAAALVANTPSTAYGCPSFRLSWSGGVPPYDIAVYTTPVGSSWNPSLDISQLPTIGTILDTHGLTSTSFSWDTQDIRVDYSIQLALVVKDGSGASAVSGLFWVDGCHDLYVVTSSQTPSTTQSPARPTTSPSSISLQAVVDTTTSETTTSETTTLKTAASETSTSATTTSIPSESTRSGAEITQSSSVSSLSLSISISSSSAAVTDLSSPSATTKFIALGQGSKVSSIPSTSSGSTNVSTDALDPDHGNTGSSNHPSNSEGSHNVGAIVGGVIGGLLALLALFLLFWWHKRRSRRGLEANRDITSTQEGLPAQPLLVHRHFIPTPFPVIGPTAQEAPLSAPAAATAATAAAAAAAVKPPSAPGVVPVVASLAASPVLQDVKEEIPPQTQVITPAAPKPGKATKTTPGGSTMDVIRSLPFSSAAPPKAPSQLSPPIAVTHFPATPTPTPPPVPDIVSAPTHAEDAEYATTHTDLLPPLYRPEWILQREDAGGA